MGRRPKVQKTPQEKWQIVLEGLKRGNIAETCRRYEIAPALYYRWKDEVEQAAVAALGGGEAPPRGLTPSRRNESSSWNGRWAARSCRSRS